MASVSKIIDHAENTCRSHGSRLTEKRKRVLAGLLEADGPISAYELTEACKENSETAIPVMSVYRILDFLQQENLAHKLESQNKFIACSHISCEHEHEVPQFLICDNCSKVEEMGLEPSVIKALKRSASNAGYSLTHSQLELHCLCGDCTTNDGSE